MQAIHKQRTRERIDYVRDTLLAAQCMPKDVTKYIAELQVAVGDKPAAEPAPTGGKEFLAKNRKFVLPPKAAKRKT